MPSVVKDHPEPTAAAKKNKKSSPQLSANHPGRLPVQVCTFDALTHPGVNHDNKDTTKGARRCHRSRSPPSGTTSH